MSLRSRLAPLKRRVEAMVARDVDAAVKPALGVEGHLDPEEAQLLFELARGVKEGGCIVEIGSFRGRSTVALGLGSRAGAGVRVYALDPHAPTVGVCGGEFGPRDRVIFLRNLLRTGVADLVCPIALSSEVVTPGWTEPVSLLWIDGDHSYEGVRRDWDCWRPKLASDATIVFHDSVREDLGPARLLRELTADGAWKVVDRRNLSSVVRAAPG